MCPIYPATCKPEDVLQAEKSMQKRYYFTDVHVKGAYLPNILKYWDRKGYHTDVTEEDLEIRSLSMGKMYKLSIFTIPFRRHSYNLPEGSSEIAGTVKSAHMCDIDDFFLRILN